MNNFRRYIQVHTVYEYTKLNKICNVTVILLLYVLVCMYVLYISSSMYLYIQIKGVSYKRLNLEITSTKALLQPVTLTCPNAGVVGIPVALYSTGLFCPVPVTGRNQPLKNGSS